MSTYEMLEASETHQCLSNGIGCHGKFIKMLSTLNNYIENISFLNYFLCQEENNKEMMDNNVFSLCLLSSSYNVNFYRQKTP